MLKLFRHYWPYFCWPILALLGSLMSVVALGMFLVGLILGYLAINWLGDNLLLLLPTYLVGMFVIRLVEFYRHREMSGVTLLFVTLGGLFTGMLIGLVA